MFKPNAKCAFSPPNRGFRRFLSFFGINLVIIIGKFIAKT